MEGLFRVPGNSVRQQALRELLNSGADVDLESGDFHPNDVATLLKTFLGELPEPLLTHRHFHAHLKIAGMITDALLHSSEPKCKIIQMFPDDVLMFQCLLDNLVPYLKVPY